MIGISPLPQTSDCGILSVLFPFFLKYKRSDKQGEFFKERQGMRAIEGSSVLVVEVLKAPYKRCVASF